MEPKDKEKEEKDEESNPTNNFDSDKRRETGIENLVLRATILRSPVTNFQDPVMHSFHSRATSVTTATKNENSFPHEEHKKFKSVCIENSSDNITTRIAEEPLFMILPLHSNSKMGAIPVLPVGNIPHNADKCCTSPDLIKDQFSSNKYHQNERIVNSGPSLSLPVSVVDNSDFLSIQSAVSCEIAHPVDDLILNVARQNLKSLKNNENTSLVSSYSSQLLKTSQNSALKIENTNDEETKQEKQKIKDIKSLNVNTDSGRCQKHELNIMTNDKVKYLDNTIDKKQKIKDISKRSLLTGKNEHTGGVAEPIYEIIEDETENQHQIENQQECITSKMDISKREHSESYFSKNHELFDTIRAKLEEQDSLEIQRSEIFHGTDSGTSCKIEEYEYKDDVDERNFDEMWINYANRPLLPLKLTHKQRSLSCTSLVQTIKGFSKRNSADNNRFLSVEPTVKSTVQSKEICASEANISKDCKSKVSQLKGLEPRGGDNILEPPAAKNYPWYHEIDAKEASKRLLRMQQDGVFLIRPASNPTNYIFHTLCVTYDACVYNMYIRRMKNGLIALGKKKESEKTFTSIQEMIRYYQSVPISIHLAQVGKPGKVFLLITPPK